MLERREEKVLISCVLDAGTFGSDRYIHSGSPIAPGRLTPNQQRIAEQFDGVELGFVSSALVYDKAVRNLSRRDHRTLIALVKGGTLDVYRVWDPNREHRDYYVIRRSGAKS